MSKKIDETYNEPGKIMFFRGEYDFLSNFHPCKITDFEGNVFQCAEAMFQSYKTTDPEERKKFTKMNGKESKAAGRKVKLRDDWEEIKRYVMWYVVYQKFSQDQGLGKLLIQTGRAEIIEGNNWHDQYWGRYYKKIPFKDGDREVLVGQNHLGTILMQVRDVIVSRQLPSYTAWNWDYDEDDDEDRPVRRSIQPRNRRNDLSPSITYICDRRPLDEYLSMLKDLRAMILAQTESETSETVDEDPVE